VASKNYADLVGRQLADVADGLFSAVRRLGWSADRLAADRERRLPAGFERVARGTLADVLGIRMLGRCPLGGRNDHAGGHDFLDTRERLDVGCDRSPRQSVSSIGRFADLAN